MKIIPGGVTAPAGFRAAGLHVGIRRNKLKKDMALLVSDVPAHVAGAFTQNMVQAAPVIYDRRYAPELRKYETPRYTECHVLCDGCDF